MVRSTPQLGHSKPPATGCACTALLRAGLGFWLAAALYLLVRGQPQKLPAAGGAGDGAARAVTAAHAAETGWCRAEKAAAERREGSAADLLDWAQREEYLRDVRRAASRVVVRSDEFVELADSSSGFTLPVGTAITISVPASDRRLWFECRLLSPQNGTLTTCSADPLDAVDPRPSASGAEPQPPRAQEHLLYAVTASSVPHPGLWHVALYLAHVGARGGHPGPGDIRHGVQYIGWEYLPRHAVTLRAQSAGGGGELPPVHPPAACGYYTLRRGVAGPPLFSVDPLTLAPSTAPRPALPPPGCEPVSWRSCVRAAAPACAAPAEPQAGLPSRLQAAGGDRKHVVLVGDSHMRGWRDVFAAALGKSVDPATEPAMLSVQRYGQFSYIRLEGLAMTDKPGKSKIPAPYREGSQHLSHQLGLLDDLLAELAATFGAANGPGGNGTLTVVVALNAGSWDLRDVSVEEYCRRVGVLRSMLGARRLPVKRRSGWGPRVVVKWVWRTVPAYSYGGKDLRNGDLRTNEKVAAANACAADVLRAGFAGWTVHDTFTYTHPVFLSPCDTHHFLCPVREDTNVTADDCVLASETGQVLARGCAGKHDLLDFLQLL
ncbi:hypothetical protein DIPPA_18159 [Diplonema papillatum]|nr:hypothetical protein DIPPA_18159 [Diplonema papillatum]|eukprot:gene14221-21806_t